MAGERRPFSLSDEVDDVWDELAADEDISRRNMVRLDLGPRINHAKHDIGPTTSEEADFFEDAADPIYIDRRLSTGVHCMDDNVTRPGMQLPGGFIETWVASRMLDHRLNARPRSELYARALKYAEYGDEKVWVHGKLCAAADGMREALWALSSHSPDALEFTGQTMEALKLNFDAADGDRSILTGNSRAYKDSLWDIDFAESLGYLRSQELVNYEQFDPKHRAAGLRIDVSEEGNLFNNALFRRNHMTSDGEPVGLLSVTLSAYRNYLIEMGLQDNDLSREVRHAALFTFGMAKIAGHDYMPAALIKSDSQ